MKKKSIWSNKFGQITDIDNIQIRGHILLRVKVGVRELQHIGVRVFSQTVWDCNFIEIFVGFVTPN